MIRQFKLEDAEGAADLKCWLTDRPWLQRGVSITLRETGQRRWRIVKRYDTLLEDTADVRRWYVGAITPAKPAAGREP